MNEKSIILYHGTDVKIPTPDLAKCKKFRDFGKAFYLSYNKELAKDWAIKRNSVSAKINDYGIVLNGVESCTLKIKRFKADEQWAKFVYNNRTNKKFVRPNYDIIIGPIADNTLQNWFNKIEEEGMTFSEVASHIQYAKFKDDQYAFCSPRSLKLLKWEECHDCQH